MLEKIIFGFTFISVLMFYPIVMLAQTTFYSNQNGMPVGQATQMGNTTFYSNANGMPAGQAQQMGNTIFYSNQNGMPVGQAQTPFVPAGQSATTSPLSPLPPANMFGNR